MVSLVLSTMSNVALSLVHDYHIFTALRFFSGVSAAGMIQTGYVMSELSIYLIMYKLGCNLLYKKYSNFNLSLRKGKRSDSVLWQKSLHPQKKNSKKPNMTTHKRHRKNSITQRLRTDLGRSVLVTTAVELVWLNRFTGSQPSQLPQKLCNQKDTHLNKMLIILLTKTEDQQPTKADRP